MNNWPIFNIEKTNFNTFEKTTVFKLLKFTIKDMCKLTHVNNNLLIRAVKNMSLLN